MLVNDVVDRALTSKKESEEVRKLRRKNKQLEEELAFLKKAAAYFANDQK